jgi:8-oxoguanine deaminase
MVGGTWRVIDGMPAGIDIAELRAAHGAMAQLFL